MGPAAIATPEARCMPHPASAHGGRRSRFPRIRPARTGIRTAIVRPITAPEFPAGATRSLIRPSENSRPATAAICNSRRVGAGSRSMRAITTSRIVAGTACAPSVSSPTCSASCSRKNGLPSAQSGSVRPAARAAASGRAPSAAPGGCPRGSAAATRFARRRTCRSTPADSPPVGRDDEDLRAGQALDQGVEELLRDLVDPVQVFERQHQWPVTAGIDRELPSGWRRRAP